MALFSARVLCSAEPFDCKVIFMARSFLTHFSRVGCHWVTASRVMLGVGHYFIIPHCKMIEVPALQHMFLVQ